MDCKFSKKERLHSKKLIKELFDKGSSFFLYPFKVIYLDEPGISANQLLVSVSKKKLKNATDRNHVKRRVKEAYRLNKHLLSTGQGVAKLVALIYVSKDLAEFHQVAPKVIKILKRIPVAKPSEK